MEGDLSAGPFRSTRFRGANLVANNYAKVWAMVERNRVAELEAIIDDLRAEIERLKLRLSYAEEYLDIDTLMGLDDDLQKPS